MDAKKAQKLRVAHRKIADGLAAEVPGLIAHRKELPPKKLEMKRIELFETLSAIRKFDEIIEGDVCEKDGDILKEIQETKEINSEFHRALLLLDEVLCDKTSTGSEGSMGRKEDRVVRPKLRKLSLRKFDGDPKGWLEFWDSFEGTIDSNPELSDRDKFEYLRDSLEGNAQRVVAGFRLTESNYKVALQMLKNRFGKEDEIGRAHYDELTKLQPIYSDKNIARVRKLYDDVEFHHRALQALGKSQEKYADVFVPMIESKLPENIRVSVLSQKTGQWNMDELLEVLSKEISIREASKPSFTPNKDTQGGREIPRKTPPSTASSLFVGNESKKCVFCYGEEHLSENCNKVTDIKKRKELIRKYGRCFVCLKRNHKARDCRSSSKCSKCTEKHHVSICEKEKERESNDIGPGLHVKDGRSIAMQTAQAYIRLGGSDKKVRCRVLFDSGSQRSFISSSVAKMFGDFGDQCDKEWLMVSGFGESEGKEMYCNIHKLEVESIKGGDSIKMDATEVSVISRGLKNKHIERVKDSYQHLKGLWFSDVSERETLEIHVLVGSDFLWSFQKDGIVRGEASDPVAVDTKLGYVLSGPMKGIAGEPVVANLCVSGRSEISDSFNKLWDLETIGIREGDPIHESLIDDITFNGERYSVGLPWKKGVGEPDLNKHNAMNRLKSLVRKLQKEPEMMKQYDQIFKEQEKEGIIERVQEVNISNAEGRVHMLPHHAVIRKEAETTKVRVVYNASSKERRSGVSLNDTLHVGPSLTPLLYDVLLRFRCHKVVLIGDIRKAFLSIEVQEKDRDALRFFWVENLEDKTVDNPVVFRSCRVIFGAGPSPFILSSVLQHHIQQYAKEDPEFAEKLKKGYYVDDLITGCENIEEAFQLYEKTMHRMKEGGFLMRKWKSNSKELINKIQEDQAEGKSEANESSEESHAQITQENTLGEGEKVLGLHWDTQEDSIKFKLTKIAEREDNCQSITKRSILQGLASLYDPLGLISPVMVKAKILFQDVCREKVSWDDELPEPYRERWLQWLTDLKETEEIAVRRCMVGKKDDVVKEINLHGFCDASEKAYCCAIYLHVVTEKDQEVTLLTSKTRVSPLKGMSIPRLELTAARTLATLLETVKEALPGEVVLNSINLWTDSMTTLWWIRNQKEWKQYVKNRVNEILQTTEIKDWRHCPGLQNPADLGSRGTKATELKGNEMWFTGPDWITDRKNWPANDRIDETEESLEEKRQDEIPVLVSSTENEGVSNILKVIELTRYSTIEKARRVTAYVLRFVANLKTKRGKKVKASGRLSVQELKDAEAELIKGAQKEIPRDKKFKDMERDLGLEIEEGILKCAGRLKNSDLAEGAKRPILLPRDHMLTDLYIRRAHENVLHWGVRATLAELRNKYWVPQARRQVKKMKLKCVTCRRYGGKVYPAPSMASLPSYRVQEARPFSKIGVDFAGPLFVVNGKKTLKVYICLYTCAVSRALHLEMTESLNLSSFFLGFRRFVGRRGMPSVVVSDNAKTFQAAVKFLKRLMENDEALKYLEDNNVSWKFNLSRAPWWGGFFERMVGCVKRTLRRVLGNARLTSTELNTTLIEIEGTLNNRPLTYEYEEANEEMLTPSHLLYGYRFDVIPDDVKDEEDESSVQKRHRYLANKRRHFWRRWKSEYLINLREHHHMVARKSGRTVQEGDVVIVMDENKLPRGRWKLGHVVKLIKGTDGIARGATVDVSVNGRARMQLNRPVQKLVPLEVNLPVELVTGKKEVRSLRNLPKRAAALDADWRRKMLDQQADPRGECVGSPTPVRD